MTKICENVETMDRDPLTGIPTDEGEFIKLLNDPTFTEYLNTFLSLPVFGKTLSYNHTTGSFDTDPPLPRTRYHVPKSGVREWVRQERLPFFWRTDLFLEYVLYTRLYSAAEQYAGTCGEPNQLRVHLCTVADMRRFNAFLRDSAGERILLFWLDAERYRRHVKPRNRRFTFRDIQARYLRNGSPRELPEIIKWTAMCGGTSQLDRKSSFKFPKSVTKRICQLDSSIFSNDVFLAAQNKVVERLTTYWVPKYIEHKKYITKIINERRATLAHLRGEKKPETKQISPLPELDAPASPSESENDMNEKMEDRCASAIESATNSKQELRARNLQDWTRWFWAGVDGESGTEPHIEPPEDMPLALRRLGGIQFREKITSAPPSTPPGCENEKILMNRTMEEEEEKGKELKDVTTILVSSSSFSHFQTKLLSSTEKDKSQSEPTIPTAEFVARRTTFENKDETDSHEKSCGEDIAENEEILDLPKPLTPYALLSSPPKRMKTVYEALSMARNTKTLDENEERYSPFPGSPSSPRSSAESPLNTIAVMERISIHRVIPFEELESDLISVITKPRTLYSRGSWNKQDYLSVTVSDLINSNQRELVVIADQLAGGPYRDYLVKTKANLALTSLEFWEDAQRYLTASEIGSLQRYRMAKTLIATYIVPGSPRQMDINRRIRDDLMRFLLQDRGDYLLSRVAKTAIEIAAEPWSEYLRADKDHFIDSVGIPKMSELMKTEEIPVLTAEMALFGKSQQLRALELAISLGVSGFCLVCDNEFQDCDDSERIEEEEQFKVLSLKEKISDARGERRASHFYGQATRLSFDATDGTNKMSAVKARPPKPRSFHDILHDSVQLMWFKRFLTEKNSEVPLSFWQAVENMKNNCKDAKARQSRAAIIVRKYFVNIPSSAVEYLHCKADIIRDIPLLPKTTPPMLVSAQACVARSMEENWYTEYMRTFPEDESEGENAGRYATRNTLAGVYKMAAHGKTRGLWAMFTHNILSFQRGIHNPETLRAFKIFLRKESRLTIEQNLVRHSMHPSRRLVNSKVINTDRLVSDLEFWLEVERFKELADNAADCAKSGNYTLDDENLLHDKARTIVKCYVDSDLPPRIQINAPIDIAENIVGMVSGGIVERGLFHDAALSVFTPLLFFWKKFCVDSETEDEETFAVPKKSSSKKKLMSAIGKTRYRKIYVPQEDESHWSYSLYQGLRLYLPLRFLVARRVNELGRQSQGADILSRQSAS